jgi:glycosyltransferase involved in cell wall biosynthesis
VHIGVVTTSYPRTSDDPSGQFVAGLNGYLRRSGHTVETLAAGATAPSDEAESVLRVPSSLFYGGGAPDALCRGPTAWLEALRFSTRLGRLLAWREAHFDALVSHWLVPCGLLASLLAPKKPHVAIAHSSDVHLLRRLDLEVLARYVASRARLVYTAPSLRIPGAAGVVTPMGIDTAHFHADPAERLAVRARHGATRPTVLFLGRLVPVKGVAVLLEAVARQPSLDLWIAGDGPLRPSLQAAAAPLSPRVRFFGSVGKELRRELLLGCDALAVPSLLLPDGRTEGAPQVVLEGLSAGCSVVVSAAGGMPELIGDAGRVVPPADAAALGAALLAAVQPEPRRQERARQVASGYDWTVLGPRIVPWARPEAPISPRES